MNNVNLIGRIASDTLKFHIDQFNKDVVKFALAFDNRTRKTDGRKDTYFIECEAWDVVGQKIYEHCNRGDKIGVYGHLEQAKFKRKDGSNSSMIKLVVCGVDFLFEPHKKEEVFDEESDIDYQIPDDTDLPL